jgi:membrane protein implicated in regulation of membrane protease activity
MTDERPEDTTTVLKRIAPGVAWLPRVVRDNLSIAAVSGLIVGIFTAGVTWAVIGIRLAEISDLSKQVMELRIQIATLTVEVHDARRDIDNQGQKWQRVETEADKAGTHKGRRK